MGPSLNADLWTVKVVSRGCLLLLLYSIFSVFFLLLVFVSVSSLLLTKQNYLCVLFFSLTTFCFWLCACVILMKKPIQIVCIMSYRQDSIPSLLSSQSFCFILCFLSLCPARSWSCVVTFYSLINFSLFVSHFAFFINNNNNKKNKNIISTGPNNLN